MQDHGFYGPVFLFNFIFVKNFLFSCNFFATSPLYIDVRNKKTHFRRIRKWDF